MRCFRHQVQGKLQLEKQQEQDMCFKKHQGMQANLRMENGKRHVRNHISNTNVDRIAARTWFELFAAALQEYGNVVHAIQLTSWR